MEQSAVLHPSEQRAADVVENSASAGKVYGGFTVAVNDGTTSSIWLIDEVKTTTT